MFVRYKDMSIISCFRINARKILNQIKSKITMDDKQAQLISASVASAINVVSLSLTDSSVGVFSAVSPLVQVAIENSLLAIGAKRLSGREKLRIGSAVWWACKVAEENINSGLTIKHDQFEEDEVTALIESVFRAASEDCQEKKDQAYGSFLGNFAFQDHFDRGALFSMAKILKDLSYDELLLIAALNGESGKNYESFYEKLAREDDLRCGEMVGYFVRLGNLGITKKVAPFVLGSNIGNIQLSALGKELCRQARLCDMDAEQCEALRRYINTFARPAGI